MDEPERWTPREGRFAPSASLRLLAARGLLVNGAFLTGVNLLSLSRGLIMAGFLTTAEYGVWGALVAIVATATLLRYVGIGDRFVQQDEQDQEAEFQRAFTMELFVSTAVAAIGAVVLLVVAAAYDIPAVVEPGLVLLAAIPLGALQMPLVIFYRRMDFARQRLLQSAEPLVAFVVTIGLAIEGMGYWALVLGGIAGAVTGALVAVAWSPYKLRLRRPRTRLRAYVTFSWPIALGGFSSIVLAQGLLGFGEATLGLAGVGIIALTTQISQFADRADRAITDTLYPALCAVKDRTDLLHESFLKSNRLALIWAVPFGVGVALFADDLLVRGFGQDWAPGVDLLRTTALVLAVNQLGFNWMAFYRAIGNTRPLVTEALVGIAVYCAVVFPLLRAEGFVGLMIGIVVAQAVSQGVRWYFLRKLFPGLRAVRHVLRATLPVVPGALGVLGLRALEGGGRGAGEIALELAVFLACTAIATVRLERALLDEMLGYVRRRAPAAA